MRLITILLFLFCLAFAPSRASATIATLGLSTQNVTFTGLGGNAEGQGQSRVTWGSCAFDGTNTKCTVSGPFTGLGGGTYNFVLTYPGNGPSPLTGISQTPGNDFVFFNLTSGSLVMTLAESNGTNVTLYDPLHFNFLFNNFTCTGVAACGVGQVGLTPNATISGPVTGAYDATPFIRDTSGVISAGDFGAFPAIAPGTWIEIYGSNLATTLRQTWATADFNGNNAPTALGGTTVTIGGQRAFVDFVSPGQVNAQVPSGLPATPQPVVVTTAGGASAPTTVTVNAVQPGLLAPPAFRLNGQQHPAAVFSDGFTFVLPPGAITGLRTARAKAGDIITFYGVGFGPLTPDLPAGQIARQTDTLQMPFQISFAGMPASVQYSGLVGGFVGLYQFNVTVPNVAASDSVPVTFTVGGTSGSQILTIAVQ